MFARELQRLKCGAFGMRQAQQKDVGRKLSNHRDRGGTIRNFALNHESWFCFEKTTQAMSKDGMLTGNDQPDEFGVIGHGYPVDARVRAYTRARNGDL